MAQNFEMSRATFTLTDMCADTDTDSRFQWCSTICSVLVPCQYSFQCNGEFDHTVAMF